MKKQDSESRNENYVNRKWGVPLYKHFNPSKVVRAECVQLATPSFNPFWLVHWRLDKVILMPWRGFWACDLAPWQPLMLAWFYQGFIDDWLCKEVVHWRLPGPTRASLTTGSARRLYIGVFRVCLSASGLLAPISYWWHGGLPVCIRASRTDFTSMAQGFSTLWCWISKQFSNLVSLQCFWHNSLSFWTAVHSHHNC